MAIEGVPAKPYCYIQWKGTDACMDFWCECGAGGHIDEAFAYFLKCSVCGRAYRNGSYVTLEPISKAEEQNAHRVILVNCAGNG